MNHFITYGHNNPTNLIGSHGHFGENVKSYNYAMSILNFHKVITSSSRSSGLKHLCRFCLKRASKYIDQKSLESFKMLTNSTLVSTPEYPSSICSLCATQLQSACKLRVSLLNMERCWSEFFHQDYQKFLKSISISEEHIYDEIFLEIEMEIKDGDTSSVRSFDKRPLLESKIGQQPLFKKSHIGNPQSVQALNLSDINIHGPSGGWCDQNQYTTYDQSSHHQTVMQNMKNAEMEAKRSLDLSDYTRLGGSMSEDRISGRQSLERNHETVSLSSDVVDYCLPTENKLDEWRNAGGSEANKTEIKCVVVGNAAVGKTNLILSYLKNEFDDQHLPTACDIYKFDVDVNERLVQVMLYDTAGQDSLDPLRRLSYTDCDVFLLCFSVVQPESFQAIKRKWAPKFRHTTASLVLVGTQTDLRSDSQTIGNLKKRSLCPVASTDGQKLARSMRAKYMETSSRNNDGVKATFDAAVEMVLNKTETEDSDDELQNSWCDLLCMCCVG